MFRIGCHLSSSKGFLAMAKQAEEIGANTFQFFTRNPRGGKAKDLDVKDSCISAVCCGAWHRADSCPCTLYNKCLRQR